MGRQIPFGMRRYYVQNAMYGTAFQHYQRELYPGKVNLFYSSDASLGENENWDYISSERIDPICINGTDHLNILDEPYVKEWALPLKKWLDADYSSKAPMEEKTSDNVKTSTFES
jgi:thioesterase domain-containing protein